MNKNVGDLDRILRILFGAALLPFLFFTKGFTKVIGLLGIPLLVTGQTQKCGMYKMMGKSTAKSSES